MASTAAGAAAVGDGGDETTTTKQRRRQRVEELKRRADALKESGDADLARRCLAEARRVELDLEFGDGVGDSGGAAPPPSSLLDECRDPKRLQRYALFLKTNRNDLDGARAALAKAKQLTLHLAESEQQQQQEQQQHQQQEQKQQEQTKAQQANEESGRHDSGTVGAASSSGTGGAARAATSSADAKTEDGGSGRPAVDDEIGAGESAAKGGHEEDEVASVDEDDEALLAELAGDGGDDGDDAAFDPSQVAYTADEMQDEEMMVELKVGGMPVPSDDEYRSQILRCKKDALAAKKSGDIGSAKDKLRQSKLLESVRVALSHQVAGEIGLRINEDDDGWMEELDDAERQLLGEAILGTGRTGSGGSKTKAGAATMLELDDLDALDASTLHDMLEMGIAKVPSVDSVLEQSELRRDDARRLKSQNNIDGAKRALLESKKLQAQAVKLRELLREVEQLKGGGAVPSGGDGGGGVSDDALNALLDGDSSKLLRTEGRAEQLTQQPPTGTTKSAEELKQEALRLRNEKNMVEATKVFRLYKQALQREAEAAELERRKEMMRSVEEEFPLVRRQLRMFTYYHRFVDSTVGAQQLRRWNEYEAACRKAIKFLQQQGASKGVDITRNNRKNNNFLLRFDSPSGDVGGVDDDAATIRRFVESGIDPTEERLEVSVVDLRNLGENKPLQKVRRHQKQRGKLQSSGSFRVDVTIHLPPNEHEMEHSIELAFMPKSSSSRAEGDQQLCAAEDDDDTCNFDDTKYVEIARGDSKFAKKVIQRMERRRVTVSVYHVPTASLDATVDSDTAAAENSKRNKGWFWSGSKKEGDINKADGDDDVNEDGEDGVTLLGKVVLETKDLLTGNCIVGDYPLLSGGSRPVGGTIGICLRTGVAFDPQRQKGASEDAGDEMPSTARPMPYREVMSFMSSSESSGTKQESAGVAVD